MSKVLIVPRGASDGSTPKMDESEVSSSSSASEYGSSRRETEQILDYYQSEDAGRTYNRKYSKSTSPDSHPAHHGQETPLASARSAMWPSTSSIVGRESNKNPGRISVESVASSSGGVQRRTSQRSAGGADKRRLAIVELDTPNESQMSALGEQKTDTRHSQGLDVTLLARRGVDGSRLGGLALVGPPDTQPMNFVGLLPSPASAPATGVPPMYQETKTEPPHSGHQRSMSDVPSPGRKAGTKAAPRDVGIVGTLGSMHSSTQEQPHREHQRPSTSDGHSGAGGASSNSLTAPVFQTPRSRSPSPLPLAVVTPSSSSNSLETPRLARDWTADEQLTPTIGQAKDIGRPVVGPVVLELTSGQPFIGRSPRSTTNGLPATELQMGTLQSYADRDPPRTSGRLPFKPNQSGPTFLHYQPGVHSTAGPLPSPPRQIFTRQKSLPPPRPPRVLSPPGTRRNEIDHTKNTSKVVLPDGLKSMPVTSKPLVPASLADSDYSISPVSVSSNGSDDRPPALSSNTLLESETDPKLAGHHDQTDKTPVRKPSHVREGAFPPNSVFLSHPSQTPPSQSQHQNLDTLVASIGGSAEHDGASSSGSAVPSAAAVPQLYQGQPTLKRENSWVSLSAESFGGGQDDSSPPSSYPSSPEGSTRGVTTGVGSDVGLSSRRRASLPAPPSELHRRADSLPRMSSLLSISRPTRPQAPSLLSHSQMPKKAPSSWPDAMNFSDVLGRKTSAERALAYAAKLRELATEQTGLNQWLISVRKDRRDTAAVPSPAATSRVVGKQPRHLSRNSMASEVTFPIRNDSYTATDLSPRHHADFSPPTSPTTMLPYPYLAQGVGIRKRSSRTFTVDSSVTSLSGSSRSLGAGFFASIGRKASIKKDRPFAPSSPNKLIPSRQPPQPPKPRPVMLGIPPTLPGGPRAPARSTQRAQSVVFKSPEPPRSEVLSMPARTSVESTTTIDRQVEKLSDLLPLASKDILAGYLRRAHNQDPMLAIGTYLEDEKQGCLRED